MGRGRAKAKQQKVARELKYNTHFTDLEALQRELVSQNRSPSSSAEQDEDEDGTGDESDDEESDARAAYASWSDDDWTGTGR